MAGALLVTDMPNDEVEFEANFGHLICRIDPRQSDEQIAYAVNERLRNLDTLQFTAEQGRRQALECLTIDHYAQRFLQVVS